MQTKEARRKFLESFNRHAHTIIPSSPVIPHDDPTLLFTNAGMNQFKDVFLGHSKRDYSRAATSQKCIRAGGKHNDLENVGHTSRHLTFFEMLGNFSFGDYFKKEAIQFAWEISTEVLGIDASRIWPSVFHKDDEAFELWTAYVPAERIARFGESENFWAMGESGPCGPCSELYYDRGPDYGEYNRLDQDPDGNRFLEFWNLVFMQYNRTPEGQTPLPKPSIDTGMGLERLMALKQDCLSVFDIDLFAPIMHGIETLCKKKYQSDDPHTAPAFRVIADHLRSLSFAIADGAQPSNVERGYVLRKILRRAVRYGRSLKIEGPFLAQLLPALIEAMGDPYIELIQSKERIAELLTSEEEAFLRTLKRGGNMLGQVIETSRTHGNLITGEDAFKLKDTYGLPFEEIKLIAKDSGLDVDQTRFTELEEQAREKSKAAHKSTAQTAEESLFTAFLEQEGPTAFEGYHATAAQGTIKALLKNNQFVDILKEGEEGIIILERTPFYAEKGGQVGDKGQLSTSHALFQVENCQIPYKGIIGHMGKMVKGSLTVDTTLTAAIDTERRARIANNHTATHLMHWALRTVLGAHVRQAGSIVTPDLLRFDFSHHKALTEEEKTKIEDLVNAKIRENSPVHTEEIPYTQAQQDHSIIQFFGDKYDSLVRVVDINSFSKELCGGTHTARTGNIGLFRIEQESSIAAGVRRIVALCGAAAEEFVRESEKRLQQLADTLKTKPSLIEERLKKLLEEQEQLENALKGFKNNLLAQHVEKALEQTIEIHGTPVLIGVISIPPADLKEFVDLMSQKLKEAIIVVGAVQGDQCQLIASVAESLVKKGVQAQVLIKEIAPCIQGGGGGRAQLAQAGGKKASGLNEALEKAKQWLSHALEKIDRA